MPNIELGNLLEEVTRFTDDPDVISFIDDLMEFEKNSPYTFKSEIRDMLTEHLDTE